MVARPPQLRQQMARVVAAARAGQVARAERVVLAAELALARVAAAGVEILAVPESIQLMEPMAARAAIAMDLAASRGVELALGQPPAAYLLASGKLVLVVAVEAAGRTLEHTYLARQAARVGCGFQHSERQPGRAVAVAERAAAQRLAAAVSTARARVAWQAQQQPTARKASS